MIENVSIDGADEHRHLSADAGIGELIVAGRVGLRVVHGLHATLKLNENDLRAGDRLAVGAICDSAGDGAGMRGRSEKRQDEKCADGEILRAIHDCRAFSDAAWRVAAVGVPPVKVSISARTRAASISKDCFVSS